MAALEFMLFLFGIFRMAKYALGLLLDGADFLIRRKVSRKRIKDFKKIEVFRRPDNKFTVVKTGNTAVIIDRNGDTFQLSLIGDD
jgi:hypothetical protein